jgi:hypothetical protein
LGGFLSPVLGVGGGQNSGPSLVQPGAFYLLHDGDAKDALQSSVYLAPILFGCCWQRFQVCSRRGYVLAGRGEGEELLLHGPTCLRR